MSSDDSTAAELIRTQKLWLSSVSTAAELKFVPRMSSLGTQNELSGDSKCSPPTSQMSSVGHLAPDPWKPYEKHQKDPIINLLPVSLGCPSDRFSPAMARATKKNQKRYTFGG